MLTTLTKLITLTTLTKMTALTTLTNLTTLTTQTNPDNPDQADHPDIPDQADHPHHHFVTKFLISEHFFLSFLVWEVMSICQNGFSAKRLFATLIANTAG